MPSIYDLKPAFQRLLQPCMNGLARLGVTPNQITAATLLLSLAGGLTLWFGAGQRWVLFLLPAVLFVRMALNALDGMMARQRGLSTPLGEILNEVGDVLSDAFLYLPLLRYVGDGALAALSVWLFVYLGLLCEFSGVLAKAMIGVRRYDGPMGKSDRAFLAGLYTLLLAFWPNIADFSQCIFGAAALLLIASSLNRLRAILKPASNNPA